MFKRIQKQVERKAIDKKRRKNEDQEDSDNVSDASGSELESEDGSDLEDEGLIPMSGEEDSDSDDEEDSEVGSEEGDEAEAEDEDMSDASDSDPPPVSLDDALSKPIYSLEDDAEEGSSDKEESTEGPKKKLQACILCPTKLFKNDKMAEDHLKSKSHMRSKVRFAQKLLDPESLTSDDPRDIVEDILLEIEAKKEGGLKDEAEEVEEAKSTKKAGKRKSEDEKDEKPSKKRKWKEEARAAKALRQAAKEQNPALAAAAARHNAVTQTVKESAKPKPAAQSGGNREQRRLEQLLASLGPTRESFETGLKGKSVKDKVKAVLQEKKRLEGGSKGESSPTKTKITPKNTSIPQGKKTKGKK